MKKQTLSIVAALILCAASLVQTARAAMEDSAAPPDSIAMPYNIAAAADSIDATPDGIVTAPNSVAATPDGIVTIPDTIDTPGQRAASLSLDNQRAYDGMDCPYSEGYVPRVGGGVATVVLPLLCDGRLADGRLRVSVDLGSAGSMPFVCKNYEKTVWLAENAASDGTGVEGYLITLWLELKRDRVNGNYPVAIRASAEDESGGTVNFDYTVYVTISDGIAPDEKEDDGKTTAYTPKVMVKSVRCTPSQDTSGEGTTTPAGVSDASDAGGTGGAAGMSGAAGASGTTSRIVAGERMTLAVTLWNTSAGQSIGNMSVTVTAPPEGFTLATDSNAVYIGELAAGQTVDVIFEYETSPTLEPRRYDFAVSFDYAAANGMTSSGSAVAAVHITQRPNVQFDNLSIPAEVTVSDTVSASVQAMNLGRTPICNVRAVIEADGLRPYATLFIGDIAAGCAMSSSVQVTVGGLTGSSLPFGNTRGTVTYFYEDAEGNEYSEVREFSTTVVSPFSTSRAEEEAPGQWWIIMAVTGAAVLGLGTFTAAVYTKKRRRHGTAE